MTRTHALRAALGVALVAMPAGASLAQEPSAAPPKLGAPASRPKGLPDRPISVGEAVLLALVNSPTTTAADAQWQGATARWRQARSGQLPQVSATGGYTHVNQLAGAASSSSGAGYTGSITLKQLVADSRRTDEAVRQAESLRDAAKLAMDRTVADLALQVRQAFHALVQAERLVGVGEANLTARRSHAELARARLKSGLGIPYDVVRAEAAEADAMLQLNSAQAEAVQARVRLAAVMGLDGRVDIRPGDGAEPEPPKLDVARLIQRALSARPEVRQAEANAEAASHGLSAARTGQAPSIAASVILGTRGSDFPPGSDTLAAGLALQWSPFDSGLTAGRVSEARSSVDVAKAQVEAARIAVTSEVAQAWVALTMAERRVGAAESAVTSATEAVRLAQGRYRAGVGTFVDVADAQAALVGAETSRVNAVTAVEVAKAQLNRAVGVPQQLPLMEGLK
jgi:outer membrane protein